MQHIVAHAQDSASSASPSAPARAASPRVLIADDDSAIRSLLEEILQDDGYTVSTTTNGHELVQLAQQLVPDLILVDLMMPKMDGYEAIRQLRNDTRTAHLPMLILTAQLHSKDVVVGFQSGADDYITKPLDIPVLLARIKSHLRRAAQRPVSNPLTGLPGNSLLLEEIHYRLLQGTPMALLYADLDNFKVFNDTYGFARGDEAILLLAHLVQHAVALHGNPATFVGHIGGDDFTVLTTPEDMDAICQTLIETFDRAIAQLYHPDDIKRGFLSGVDRHGVLRRFGLMSLSIGVVTTQHRAFSSAAELASVAAEMKHYAKLQPGSSYAVDRRTAHALSPRKQPGSRRPIVQVVSPDAALRAVLRTALEDGGYIVQELSEIGALEFDRPGDAAPVALLADAQIGPPLWAFCRGRAGERGWPPIVVLTASADEQAQAQAAGVGACLRQPLPVDEIVACITNLSATLAQRSAPSEG
jgi:diguanylate cyclase (GGDEF)-like protein